MNGWQTTLLLALGLTITHAEQLGTAMWQQIDVGDARGWIPAKIMTLRG